MSRLVRAMAVLATAIVGGVILGACGDDDDSSDSGGSKAVNIAYLGYIVTDFNNAQVEGMKEVVEPDGGSVETFSSNFDPQKQVAQCQDAVSSGRFNAIVLVPVDPQTGIPCVTAAAEAGIPVSTMETAVGDDPYSLEPQVDGVEAVVTTPLESEVEADSQLIEEACGDADPCKVAAEVVTPSDRFTNDVVDGVQEELGDRIEIVQEVISGYDPGAVAEQMPGVLTANPDLNVFFSASDQSAVAAVPAIKEAGLSDQVAVTGRGGSSEGVAAIEDGSMFGTTGNWPRQYGVFMAEALSQAVNGDEVEEVSLDMLKADEPMVVTQETVDEFESEWGTR